MKKLYFGLLTAIVLLLSSINVHSQVQTARYTRLSNNCNAFYEYLPQGYGKKSQKYPLLIFVHGIGEKGNGSKEQLPLVLKNGPPKLISRGSFPSSFTVNRTSYSFIVLSPQFIEWPTILDLQVIINYAVKHYNVDINRIYLTGLSMGGGAVWDYASYSKTYVRRLAGIVPISGASTETDKTSKIIANSNLPVWAFHNSDDPTVRTSNSINWIKAINAVVPAPTPPAKLTIFKSSSHDAWTKAYDPDYRENGLNLYEWLLQYSREGQPPAANSAPIANAGKDKIITLPVSKVDLPGAGTDEDGKVVSYAWSKFSGPDQYNIAKSIANTTASRLVEGAYVFRLTVTDDKGATGYDDVNVTVKPEPNDPPVANAGKDKTITLPINSVKITGSGKDGDGKIASYSWSKTSGPDQYSINKTSIASPTISQLTVGTYVFRLTVTDDKGDTGYDDVSIIVKGGNVAPLANAGGDKTITLPVNSVKVSGSGTDNDGEIDGYKWTYISGPKQYGFDKTSIANPTISKLVEGTYVFRLTVTDDKGATGYDEISITVKPAPNKAPVANAGGDKTITLPVNSIKINGSGTDEDGYVESYSWSKISGPQQYAISKISAANPTISSLTEGNYVFRLTVTDDKGATVYDDVNITVQAGKNDVPVANAGKAKTITLPVNSVDLTGSASDRDGKIIDYTWSKVSGPEQYSIIKKAANTTVSKLTEGTYVFRLTVTDNKGAIAYDDVSVTVKPAPNEAPVADAGMDKGMTLPTNGIVVNGLAKDADGKIVSYNWEKLYGPKQFYISDNKIANPSISRMVAGNYVFRLTATDDKGATDYDDVTISVKPKPAIAAYPVPGVIEAKNYSSMSGVEAVSVTEGSSDLAVGRIDKSDWMGYRVNVEKTGSYKINFQVATTEKDQDFQVLNQDKKLLGTVSVPNTGSWYNWKITSATVTLEAGIQTLMIYSPTGRWSLNRIEFLGFKKNIYVNLYGDANRYKNNEWNNWNAGGAFVKSLESGALKYADGETSGISASLSSSDYVADNGADYQGGMAPAEVLRYTSYSTSERTLTLSGLSKTKQYELQLYASRQKPGNASIFTIGAESQTVNTNDNHHDKASFANLTPDKNGEIVVKIDNSYQYNYLNGFTLRVYDNSSAAKTVENKGEAAAVVASQKQLTAEKETGVKGTFGIYPNPVKDILTAQVTNEHYGDVKISITDAAGRVRKELNTTKPFKAAQLRVPLNELSSGIYFITVQIGAWKETKQLLKL